MGTGSCGNGRGMVAGRTAGTEAGWTGGKTEISISPLEKCLEIVLRDKKRCPLMSSVNSFCYTVTASS